MIETVLNYSPRCKKKLKKTAIPTIDVHSPSKQPEEFHNSNNSEIELFESEVVSDTGKSYVILNNFFILLSSIFFL